MLPDSSGIQTCCLLQNDIIVVQTIVFHVHFKFACVVFLHLRVVSKLPPYLDFLHGPRLLPHLNLTNLQNNYTNHKRMPAWNETDDRKLLLACIKLSVSSICFSVYGTEDALTDQLVEPNPQLG